MHKMAERKKLQMNLIEFDDGKRTAKAQKLLEAFWESSRAKGICRRFLDFGKSLITAHHGQIA
jgi:hypothetical protein